MGKIPSSVFRLPLSHPYYLRSSNKDREGKKEEENTKVLGDNFPRTYYFKRCQRKRLARMESLPDDLLFEILLHLPAQDIYDHARFVCRKWYHMIHTHKFLYAHFKYLDYGLLFYSDRGPSFFVAEQQGRIEISKLNYKFGSNVWLSCNGLFLEIVPHEETTICVRNHVTKQKLILPPPPILRPLIYSEMYGIACSAVSMEYKVVIVDKTFFGSRVVCSILTVGVDESWRNVEVKHLSLAARKLFLRHPLITKGFMHWARQGPRVLTLNIETEIVTKTPAPIPKDVLSEKLNAGQNKWYYMSTGRYLSLLIARGEFLWEVWEMKPETGEWRKVCNIALDGSFDLKHDKCLVPVGWLKYLEVLVFSFVWPGRTFFFYNLLTQKIDSLESLLSPPWLPSVFLNYNLFVHKNSLCWCDGC